MMTVIGMNNSPEIRAVRWSELIAARESLERFRNSSLEQERRIAEIDKDFYGRTLHSYVS